MFRRSDWGPANIQFTSKTTLASVSDGTSNTVMIGEKHVRQGYFTKDRDTPVGRVADGAIMSPSGIRSYARSMGLGGNNLITRSADSGDNQTFGSSHTEITQFVFADGSVRAVQNSTPGAIQSAIATRDGDEVFTLD